MRVVLIGATGATGSELLKRLLLDERITSVVVLVRRALPIDDPKLTVRIVNFERPGSWASWVTGDLAFSCMGTTLKAAGSRAAQYKVDHDYQLAFATAARSNRVPRFLIISASMASSKSLVFYSRMKGQLENELRRLDFPSLLIFRPGFLLRPATDRVGEKWSERILRFFNRLGWFQYLTPLPVKDLATLMLRYAGMPVTGTMIVESAQLLKESGLRP